MSLDPKSLVSEMAQKARRAQKELLKADAKAKNQALENIAVKLYSRREEIFAANKLDVDAARAKGMDAAFVDRLAISEKVLLQMIQGVRDIIALADPIGTVENMQPRPSGIKVGQMRMPIGVIGMIFESRPNVVIDASALAIKSGNALILRGGSDALESNQVLARVVQDALVEAMLPQNAVQVVLDPDREVVGAMITAKGEIDVIIPRGGKSLISRLDAEATVPMIKHLNGMCHTYVDEGADIEMAIRVVDNAKTQRFSPCNATETLLVHRRIAFDFLPEMARIFHDKNVEMRCDEASRRIVEEAGMSAIDAAPEDWDTEYNAPIINIRVVSSFDEALEHIARHGSMHTEAIVTNNLVHSQRFLREVDASSVMVNASTRFADGFEYGLGAEMGISTDRLHVRGPVGLLGLTNLKYVVVGRGEGRS